MLLPFFIFIYKKALKGLEFSKYVVVAQLNGDIKTSIYEVPMPPNNNIFTIGDVWNVTFIKFGKVVNAKINFRGAMAASDKTNTLFTIPKEYVPIRSQIHNYVSHSGKTMLLAITQEGNVQFLNLNAYLGSNEWICRQCITYITDN